MNKVQQTLILLITCAVSLSSLAQTCYEQPNLHRESQTYAVHLVRGAQ